jgi:hypothetical protein
MISTNICRIQEGSNVDDEYDNSFLSKALSNSVFFASALSSLSTAITLFVAARIAWKFAIKNTMQTIVTTRAWLYERLIWEETSQPIIATTTTV